MNAAECYEKYGKSFVVGTEFWHVSRERIAKGEGPNKVVVRAITEHTNIQTEAKQIGLIEGEGRRGFYHPKDCFLKKEDVIQHAAYYIRALQVIEDRRHASMQKRLDSAREAVLSLCPRTVTPSTN